MKRLILVCAFILLLLTVVAAAAGPGAMPRQPMHSDTSLAAFPQGSIITGSSQMAADALHQVMMGRLSKESPVLVATMVQLDDLEKTSTLGRMVMQQVASRLSQYGYRVIESRLRMDMSIRPREGEFMLTREVARLMQTQYAAQAVLVGSYVESPASVFCSLRLIRLDDGAVVAAYEYQLPNGGEVRSMLRKDRKAPVDVDPVWSEHSRRQAAYVPNGAALPPVQKFGMVRSEVPVFQGNTFQGGAGAARQPAAGLQTAPPLAGMPVLGPPDRVTQSPEPDPGAQALGPPEPAIR